MADNYKTTVFIIAATRLYREGLAGLLAAQEHLRVVGTSGCMREALVVVGRLEPDIVLFDVDIIDSLAAVRELCRPVPKTKVIAVALDDKTTQIVSCAEAGVTGFITHDGSMDDLLTAIRSAIAGELRCSPRIAAALAHRVSRLARNPGREMGVNCLTAREMEVIRLIEKGLSNKEIARSMCIGVATVKNHVHHILEKLHVRRRGQAAAVVRDFFYEL